MSYSIGTKLSYANGSERAVLFDQTKVMVTMADGQIMRQVLTLDDWLAFAGGQEIVEDTSGVSAAQKEKALKTAAASYPVRPIGTMLRALSSTHSQSAVVTEKGILIVKTTENGVISYKKLLFESEAHWRASLPDDMAVRATEPKTALQKHQEENPITSSMSDAQKLFALKKTYKIGTGCYTLPSNNENLAAGRKSLESAKQNTNLIGSLGYYEERVKKWEEKCASQTAEQNDFKPVKICPYGKSAFYLVVGDEVHGVTHFNNEQGEFIVDLKSKQLYKCFADIPGCLNAAAKPKLTVFYRNEYINLSELF